MTIEEQCIKNWKTNSELRERFGSIYDYFCALKKQEGGNNGKEEKHDEAS